MLLLQGACHWLFNVYNIPRPFQGRIPRLLFQFNSKSISIPRPFKDHSKTLPDPSFQDHSNSRLGHFSHAGWLHFYPRLCILAMNVLLPLQISAGWDMTICVWDLEKGRCVWCAWCVGCGPSVAQTVWCAWCVGCGLSVAQTVWCAWCVGCDPSVAWTVWDQFQAEPIKRTKVIL